ncbi:MAG TPA: radical SAM protein [Gammaproteobacteria bacterium]|nr:radical SAM protein [Gammaproteobacteria bacterium]
MSAASCIGYTLRRSRYLNVTNRCTLRCSFCPKFNGSWSVQGYDLRLHDEPDAETLLAAAGNPSEYDEVVFCGFGEPTLRLYTVLEVGSELRRRGARVRLNTDGLANYVYGRDVTPDFEDSVDAVSISLNAQDAATYYRHCRPPTPGAFMALLDFTKHVREFVPDVTLTAIDGLEGVDISACQRLAGQLGVAFRRRVLHQVG